MNKLTLALAVAVSLATAPAWAQAPAQPRPPQQRPAAPADPVTERTLTRDSLKAIFEAAKLKVSIDSDGDIMLKEAVTVFAFPDKDRIRLLVNYGFKPAATLQQKLELANRINHDYIVVRASVPARNQAQLAMDYYILIGSGLSKATLVAATRRFMSIVPDAVKEHDTDDIVK